MYYDDRSPAAAAAFDRVLDTRAIGERVTAKLDPRRSVAGRVWFYYAARYGEHLARAGSPEADWYLPAAVEAAPGDPDRHLLLGDFHAEQQRVARAMASYGNVLELDPDRGDAHGRMARLLWAQERQGEAVVRWHSAMDAFLRVESRGVRVPEAFWSQVTETFTDLGARRLLGQFKPDIERLLRDYVHRNAGYRLFELVEPLARAAVASGEGTAWLMDLSRVLDFPEMGAILMRLPELSPAQRAALQREIVANLVRRASSSFGSDREYREAEVRQARLALVAMLLDAGDTAQANAEWQRARGEARDGRAQRDSRAGAVEIRLAARSGTLGPLLESYRAASGGGPDADTLREAAIALRGGGDAGAARSVLEFLYDRELRGGHFEAPNFLGLAEVKLEQGETAAALAALRRMALVADDAFETLLPAADVLQRFGRGAEAAGFVRQRIAAVPWDAEAKLRLARLTAGAERERLLAGIANDPQAPYRRRAEAARAAAPKPVSPAGTELALLSSGSLAPAEAAKPYFIEARLAAAQAAADGNVRARLFREALAWEPENAAARLGALRAEIALMHDSAALALAGPAGEPEREYGGDSPPYRRRWRYRGEPVPAPALLPEVSMRDEERASLADGLAGAAERLDDLAAAQSWLRAAIGLQPADRRAPLERRARAFTAELARRTLNASRQPVVKNAIEQDQVVRPRAQRSAP